MTIKKVLKVIGIILGVIVLINVIFWGLGLSGIYPVSRLYYGSVIAKIKPLNYAVVFAHGGYTDYYPIREHRTRICRYNFTMEGRNYCWSEPTKDLLENLSNQGYNKVWVSMCGTGDYGFIYKNYTSNKTIYWDDYNVSRNEKKGITMPIFIGFGFIRLNIEEDFYKGLFNS